MASRPLRVAIAAIAVLTLSGSAALARGGTEAQREACTPDAFRLCGQFIPDEARIEACLRNAGPRLSRPCYIVFYPEEGDAQPPPRPGMRRPQPPPAYDDWDD